MGKAFGDRDEDASWSYPGILFDFDGFGRVERMVLKS